MSTARTTPEHPVILFDGVCSLCNAAVRWIIAHDRKAQFRFAALESAAGRVLLASAGAQSDRPDSLVLIENRRARWHSDAVIAVAVRLGLPWSLARAVIILPRGVRDGVYRWVARNRYRWFGIRQACMVPTPQLRARFLDADEPGV